MDAFILFVVNLTLVSVLINCIRRYICSVAVTRSWLVSLFASPTKVSPTPTSPPFYTIPDFVSFSPYKLGINPNYAYADSECLRWMDGCGVLPTGKKERDAFDGYKLSLLAAMAYPDAQYDRFRVLCDFINVSFAFDDILDEGDVKNDLEGTRNISDVVLDAVRRPFEYDAELRFGKVIADFWGRALELGCSAGTRRRFLQTTDLYLQSVKSQAKIRATGHCLDLDSWINLRRNTGASLVCFAMGEFGLNLDLPDEVFECPLIKTMEHCAADVVGLSNDIYSYNVEQAQGDTCNTISLIMESRNLDLQRAIDFVGELVKSRMRLYTASKAKLPSWGPQVDEDVQKYTQILEDWITAGFHWSLNCERYFGKNSDEVKRTLRVELLPQRCKA